MTHIIAEPCVGVKDTSCVDVCPVDCIYGADEDWDALYIQPEECIDCGLCVDERGVNEVIDDCGRGGPPDLWRYADNAFNTLTIGTR